MLVAAAAVAVVVVVVVVVHLRLGGRRVDVDVAADMIDGCVPAARMHTCTESCPRALRHAHVHCVMHALASDGLMLG